MFATKTILGLFNWKIAALAVCALGLLAGTPLISGCGRAKDVAEQVLGGVGAEGLDGLGIEGVGVGKGVEGQVSTVSDSSRIPSPVAMPSIAVIDVNKVAERSGIMNHINAMLDQEEQASRQRMAAMQTQFMQEYNLAAQQAGNQPSQQDEADLEALYQSHMQQLSAERDRSQQAIQDFHAQLKQQFIDSVRPVAAAVASSKGIPTVLTTGQVFSIEENYDITEEVIEKMQEILIRAASDSDSANAGGSLR